MSRNFKTGDVLKVGTVYGFAEEDNTFKVLCLHGPLAWVEWVDNGEVETLDMDAESLGCVIILDEGSKNA